MSDIKARDIVRHKQGLSCQTVQVAGISDGWVRFPEGHRLDGHFSGPVRDFEVVVPFVDEEMGDDGYPLVREIGKRHDILETGFKINLRPHTDAEYRQTIRRLRTLHNFYERSAEQDKFWAAFRTELIEHINKKVQARWMAWQDELDRRQGREPYQYRTEKPPQRLEPWPVPEHERSYWFGE